MVVLVVVYGGGVGVGMCVDVVLHVDNDDVDSDVVPVVVDVGHVVDVGIVGVVGGVIGCGCDGCVGCGVVVI